MNAEQKQRAKDALTNWRVDDMTALLQELIDSTKPKPVAKVMHVDGRVLPAGTALYAAPPSPSVPDVARLDWLVASDWYVGPEYNADEAGGIVGYDNKNIDGLRAAIDAAIEREKMKGGEA